MPRLALGIFMLCISTTARAQSAGDLQLDGFHPTMDSRGHLTLNAAAVLDHGEVSFGLGALEWGRHLLAFHGGGASYSVDNVVSATLVGDTLEPGGVASWSGPSVPNRMPSSRIRLLVELRDADGRGLPRHVERELAEYLRCGILGHPAP